MRSKIAVRLIIASVKKKNEREICYKTIFFDVVHLTFYLISTNKLSAKKIFFAETTKGFSLSANILTKHISDL